MKTLALLFAGLLVPLLASDTSASLLGDTISVELSLDGMEEGVEVDVVDGPELIGGRDPGLEPGESIDIEASSIKFVTNGPFDTDDAFYTFSDLDWVDFPDGFITGIIVSDGVAGFDQGDVEVGPDSLVVHAGLDDFSGEGMATITLLVTHIPEPAGAALLLLGLAGLAGARRSP